VAQSEADGMTAASSVAWQWLERCGTSLVTTDTSNDDSLLPLRFFFIWVIVVQCLSGRWWLVLMEWPWLYGDEWYRVVKRCCLDRVETFWLLLLSNIIDSSPA
jgi:hypothetical protein